MPRPFRPTRAERAKRAERAEREPARRVRRSPEEARKLILDAAQRLLASAGPDAIGLKDVAREAGVSHALVTHYFGTIDALMEAALEAHMDATRAEMLARIADVAHAGPREWIDMAFEQLAHPMSGRTLAWALLSGRVDSEDFFPRRDMGMRLVRDAIEARIRVQLGDLDAPVDRESVELGMLLVFCAALGYSVSRSVLWASLEREPSEARDRWFREKVADLVTRNIETARALTSEEKATPAKRTRRPVRRPRKKA